MKGNSFKEFFEETFSDVYDIYPERIKVIGKKLYFSTGTGTIISTEFTGPVHNSLINITFITATKYGIIDLSEVPLSRVFYHSKVDNMEKSVITKILNTAGESMIHWSVPLSDEDKRCLNEILQNYIELFSTI